MDGLKERAKFDLLFTPEPGYAVQVHSFVFDDYLHYKGRSAFTWQLFMGSDSGTLINGREETTGDGQDLEIDTGMVNPYAGAVLLRIIGGSGNDGKDEALDKIIFTQSKAVPTPEPATILLLGMGLAGFAGYRRFKK